MIPPLLFLLPKCFRSFLTSTQVTHSYSRKKRLKRCWGIANHSSSLLTLIADPDNTSHCLACFSLLYCDISLDHACVQIFTQSLRPSFHAHSVPVFFAVIMTFKMRALVLSCDSTSTTCELLSILSWYYVWPHFQPPAQLIVTSSKQRKSKHQKAGQVPRNAWD